MQKIIISLLLIICATVSHAQVGEYRNRFSVGVGGGYLLNTVGFQPKVPQSMHGGLFAGITGRYTTEKYFTTLCAIQAELNIARTGWKQKIQNYYGQPVVNPETNVEERYQRNLTYVQLPLMAHLSWGYEQRGLNFFINLGPQIGFLIGDAADKNYTTPFTKENFPDLFSNSNGRISQVTEQETMKVENKFDYGIVLGLGLEGHVKRIGRFDLEARYYYGLGNLYGDSKRDFFAKSNHGMIFIKLSYLYDL